MRAWVKMWRTESTRFAQLPLYVRGIAMEMLKITDEEGRIFHGKKSPEAAVAFALGATQGDRRLLKTAIPMLFDAGFISPGNGCLQVANFPRYQEAKNASDLAATRERESNDSDMSRERLLNESEAKCPETHDGMVVALKEVRENREELDKSVRTREEIARRNAMEIERMRAFSADAPTPTMQVESPQIELRASWFRAEYESTFRARRGFGMQPIYTSKIHPVMFAKDFTQVLEAFGEAEKFEERAKGLLRLWFTSPFGEKSGYRWEAFNAAWRDFIPNTPAANEEAFQ